MVKIQKYEVNMSDEIAIIKGCIKKILNVKFEPGTGMVVWVEIDDKCKEIEVKIVGVRTDWIIPEEMKFWDYLGTDTDGLNQEWHYYVEPFRNLVGMDLGTLFEDLFSAGGK